MSSEVRLAQLEARLQALSDREAIREALYSYCRGIDRGDEAALRAAYWPDATDRHGAYQGSAEGFIQAALPQLAKGRYIHNIANLSIHLNGDAAAVEAYFLAYQTDTDAAGAPRATFLCGRYVDLFTCRATTTAAREWRVAKRVVVYDWQDIWAAPTQDEATRFGRRLPIGARAPDDPWYALMREVAMPASP